MQAVAPNLEILTLPSQYTLTLMKFLSTNLEIDIFNSSVRDVNTRRILKLHTPSNKLTIYQKRV